MSLERFTWEAGDVVILTSPKDKVEVAKKTKAWFQGFAVTKGGPTSGNFVHFGKAGQMGGSDPGGGHGMIFESVPGGASLSPVEAIAEYRLGRFGKKEGAADQFAVPGNSGGDPNSKYEDPADARNALYKWGNHEWLDFEAFVSEKNANRLAIRYYTGDNYKRMNYPLRGKYDAFMNKSIKSRVKRLTTVLGDDRARLKRDLIAYRNAGNTFIGQLDKMQKGEVIQDNGFGSFSVQTKLNMGGRADRKIKVRFPAGMQAPYVDNVSKNPGEREILAQRGTQYRFLGYQTKAGKYVSKEPDKDDFQYYILEAIRQVPGALPGVE